MHTYDETFYGRSQLGGVAAAIGGHSTQYGYATAGRDRQSSLMSVDAEQYCFGMSANEEKGRVDQKEPYGSPEIVRLGDVLELTRGPGGVFDEIFAEAREIAKGRGLLHK
jgi:hypothetical protein